MKKLIALLLAALMLLACVGCAAKDTTPAPADDAATAPADTTPADDTKEDAAPADDTKSDNDKLVVGFAQIGQESGWRDAISSGTPLVTSTRSSWSLPMHSRNRKTRSRPSATSSRWVLTSSRSRPLLKLVGKLF